MVIEGQVDVEGEQLVVLALDARPRIALGEALHLLFEAETLGGLVLSESHGGHQRGRQHGPAGGEAQREHEAGGQAMGGTHGVSGYIAVDWDRS